MYSKLYAIRKNSFFIAISLTLALTFLLTACGTNAGTGSTPAVTPTVGASPTAAFSPEGCPTIATVVPPASAPTTVLKDANANSTINAHVGDIIEVQLPFGHRWTGPTGSMGGLQLQNPAGYPVQSEKMCVWRFTAQSAGNAELDFEGRPICKKGQLCPLYILRVPFTIDVK